MVQAPDSAGKRFARGPRNSLDGSRGWRVDIFFFDFFLGSN